MQRLFAPAFFILLFNLSGLAQAMTFEVQERCISGLTPQCQKVLLAVGQIDKDSPEQFSAAASNLPQGTWVALSSPGGSLVGGLKIGLLIREKGFNTTISSTDYSPPNCISACAYAFVGGFSRHLSEGTKYGIHQFKGTEKAIGDSESQKISATIANYLDQMGVDRHLLDYAQVTTSDKVNVLSLAQAKLLKVDNTGQSPYPRWRLEATADGKLIAINNPPNVSGKPPATLALVQLPKPLQTPIAIHATPSTDKKAEIKTVFLIFYKSDDAPLFNQKIEHQLVIQQKTYALKQAEVWQRKPNGYQASFISGNDALEALYQAPEDSMINLNSPIRNIRFGVGGFKNIYLALTGTDSKKSEK
jgi:hypothetical protein